MLKKIIQQLHKYCVCQTLMPWKVVIPYVCRHLGNIWFWEYRDCAIASKSMAIYSGRGEILYGDANFIFGIPELDPYCNNFVAEQLFSAGFI
ncbi:hypothetical protein [Floridanema evergladense]|uniref:Uncharacterized protein n=1 Tax=Floridaenema evergladense BLCC-F167 TaxID=3153639 RepID=A0ABV4WE38_9CYAN